MRLDCEPKRACMCPDGEADNAAGQVLVMLKRAPLQAKVLAAFARWVAILPVAVQRLHAG